MAVFGLLHGAFEGAWCWDYLTPALERLGHEAIAIDLPTDDVHADWDDHVDVALAAFEDPSTIVVAHSRAGRMVPALLERGGFTHVVLLSAAIPGGILPPPYESGAAPPTVYSAGRAARRVDERGRTLLTAEIAACLFSDCNPEVVAWALANARPQHELPLRPDVLWPDVSVDYIFGAEERAVDPGWIYQACKERLGIEPIELPGAHSLFISHPVELAKKLDELASAHRYSPRDNEARG